MQRIYDYFQRAKQRINARIAILVVVGLIGTVAVWQGFKHMAAKGPPAGPKKQVATGAPVAGEGGVQTAGATLTDDQLPGGGSPGTHRLVSTYGQGDSPTAEADPYADPYAGASAQPTTVPPTTDPYGGSSGGDDSPANPYRTSTNSDQPATAPPTSPYASGGIGAAVGAAGAAAGNGATSAETTVAEDDPVAAYQKKFARGATASTSDASSSGASPAANGAEAAAPETTPPSELAPITTPGALAGSPYGRQDQPAATVPAETPPRTLSSSGLNSNGLGSSRASIGPLSDSGNFGGGEAPPRAALPTPGERQLEGPQQPAVTIEKFAPAEIQVGKPATFELVVRNVGQIPAQHVVITDHIPAGTQLADVKPTPAQGSDGSLVWQLGTMQPGDETTITLQVMPQSEGEIGSTAHVTFAAQATSRSICTRPQLTIEHTAPTKVLIGESLAMGITIANPGTGPATGVMIEENVPDGLSHVAGGELEYEVGTLRPGESKRLELSLRAEKPGLIENTIIVRGEGNLNATHKVQIEVVAPQLQVDVNGPKKRFLERQATYAVSVANPGTAAARNVDLVAYLPRGMRFVEAESQGQYDQSQHAVFWSLEELPPSKAGSVKLTTMPIEPGEQRLRIEARADLGLAVAGEQIVQVEQSAELLHSVKDADEVIEVGSETTYLIKVSNVGTKAATNVRVAALLPPEIQGKAGEGPTKATGDATRVIFEPLAKLDPQEEVIFKVQVQGVAPGDHIVRVQLSSDEWPTPVTREESTRVYEDR